MLIEAAHSLAGNIVSCRINRFVNDGSQTERLINMRLRKNQANQKQAFTNPLDALRVLSKRQAGESQKALRHWMLHTTYANPEEDTIYELVLNQLAAHGTANNLLEIEKSWTQNAMRTLSLTANDTWLDANICAKPHQIEDQYKKLQDLELKLQNNASDSAQRKVQLIEQIGQDLICIAESEDNKHQDNHQCTNENWPKPQEHNLIEDRSHGQLIESVEAIEVICDPSQSSSQAKSELLDGHAYWIFEFAPVLDAANCPDFSCKHRIRRSVDDRSVANY